MSQRRYLVVNADDFGHSATINIGIIESHRAGTVTSASLMIRQPAAAEAVELSRAHPGLSIGLHLDLGEWRPHFGEWMPVYEVVELTDRAATQHEVARQIQAFYD